VAGAAGNTSFDEKTAPSTTIALNYVCLSAIDGRRGLYYQFSWESHRERALALDLHTPEAFNGSTWRVLVERLEQRSPKHKKEPRTKSKQHALPDKASASESSDSGGEDEYAPGSGDEEDEIVDDSVPESDPEDLDKAANRSITEEVVIPQTPSRRRRRAVSTPKRTPKRTATATPRKPRGRALAAPTPHSKAALRARSRNARVHVKPPPPQFMRSHYDALQQYEICFLPLSRTLRRTSQTSS
jgi:origin recognition complex subunit 1